MRVFKFGGASVKDAESVKNVANVLKHEGTQQTLVVISAMGKMTNAFEKIVDAFYNKSENLPETINFVEEFHQKIVGELFEESHPIYIEISLLFGELTGFMIKTRSQNRSYIYDQIVGFGELLSTKIVSAYLSKLGVENNWLDVRTCIKTDNSYRDAKVNWQETETAIPHHVDTSKLYITQGFLGSHKNKTTTLGREGSDYTAGIFAYCLKADSVTIWKDVEGVLNADPRVFTTTELLRQISYREAIEMAFYGASVIHPKTLQPLEQKEIPLFVRSFKDVSKTGTKVSKEVDLDPFVPCYIVKKNQIFIAVSAKDFSFMVEENISYVFRKLHKYKLKVNLIQNSALSFSVCVEDKYQTFQQFLEELATFV